jgi:Cu/Ag efflux protein CusF
MTRISIAGGFMFAVAVLSGCNSEEKIYDLKGKIVAVDHDKRTVTVDHEEIPGLMRAMKMTFGVEDAKLLDGLAAGDAITGKLKAAGTKYNLVEVHKTAGEPAKTASNPESERQAALAKLSPEDREAAETQRFCPVSKGLLGSMETPIKLMVKGQPVFICCSSCKKKVEENPDEMLAKVAEMKKK